MLSDLLKINSMSQVWCDLPLSPGLAWPQAGSIQACLPSRGFPVAILIWFQATGKGPETRESSVLQCLTCLGHTQYCDSFRKQTHWLTTWQPRLKGIESRWVSPSRSYLMRPPDHQVRECCDPGDGAKECDGEKFPRWLKDNRGGNSQGYQLWWTWQSNAKPPVQTLFLHFLQFGKIGNQKAWTPPSSSCIKFSLGNVKLVGVEWLQCWLLGWNTLDENVC